MTPAFEARASQRDDTPAISVVVPTFRRPELLDRCLRALLAQDLPPATYEIVVADDGPSRVTRRLLARLQDPHGPRLRYVPVTATQGPAAARNQGWRAARAPVVAFTDDDTVPDRGWLKAGLQALAGGAAAATGRVVMPLSDPPTDYERNESGLTRAEFVTANCFVTKAALQEVGGFDERFKVAWREDSDLQFALISRALPIVPAPRAMVVHPVRPAPRGVSLRQQRKVMYDALLYKKWPGLYRQHIRAHTRWDYLAATGSLVVASVAGLLGARRVAWTAGACWAGYTLAFCAIRLRGTSRAPAHVADMLVTSALIPPVSMFWRVAGALRFGSRLP